MHAEPWNRIDQYFEDHLLAEDPLLNEILVDNQRAGLPAADVSPGQGQLLHLLALVRGARRILEIGTLGGYSTVWLARALPTGGRVVTLELDPERARLARGHLAQAGVDHCTEIRVGEAKVQLARLKAQQAVFDLIFIDADKGNNPAYLEAALDLSRPGTLIIADNVVRAGEIVRSDSPDPAVPGLREFVRQVGLNSQLTATAVQTVGRKGHDGFLLALVRGEKNDG